MKLRVFLPILTLVFSSISSPAQPPGSLEDKGALISPGVVVESVDKDSVADKAGIKPGDLLLRWKRGDDKGVIESPFDLFFLQYEQAAREAMTVEGLRGQQPSVWVLSTLPSGMVVRPNLTPGLLLSYREGQELKRAGKRTEAAERWLAAAREAQDVTPAWLRVWFLSLAADSFAQSNQWKAADDAYQEALQSSTQFGLRVRGRLLWARALTFFRRGDWNKAEGVYGQLMEESRKSGAENLAVDALNHLGLVARTRGELAEAEEYFRQALSIQEKLNPGSNDVGSASVNLGLTAIDHGDLVLAEECLRRALDLFSRLAPGSRGITVVLNNLGVVARKRGMLDLAEEYYRQALANTMNLPPDQQDTSALLENLGIVAYDRWHLKEAQEYLQKSLKLVRNSDPGTLSEAEVLDSLGNVALRGDDFTRAASYYDLALEIEQKLAPEGTLIATTLNGLGNANKRSGDLAKAESYYRRSLAIRQKIVPLSTEHAETLAGLAEVARQSGNLTSATELYQQALNALESQTARLGGSEEVRSSFRSEHQNYYKGYLDLLLSQNQPALALQASERSRARILLEMLESAHVDIHKGADPSLLEQERSLKKLIAAKSERRLRLLGDKNNEQQITAFSKEIEDLEKRYQGLEELLRLSSPGYLALTQPQSLAADEIQHLLDPETLLLEYSLGDKRSYVFLVGVESLAVHELPKRAEIESQARHLYELLTARNRVVKGESAEARQGRIRRSDAEYLTAASTLSRTLLAPLGADLNGKRLLIVSDGALQYVPFAALPVLKSSTYVPLIMEHEIAELPSASVLAVLRAERAGRKPPSQQVIVLADPVFDAQDIRVKRTSVERVTVSTHEAAAKSVFLESDSARQLTRTLADVDLSRDGALHLPRLAFSRREAAAIVTSAKAGMSREAVDFDANRKLAISGELARYRVVHFATHALVDNVHPELSGLVLSLVDERGKPQDGFLDLEDIYNLDLAADLAVLSACDTALGKQVDGEGMIGLTRGFMYAGASHVMGTLWKVEDFATSKFMKAFYTALEQNGMQAAQALRHAQLALWKEKHWSAPYYWAAFTLQGDWK